MKRLIPILLAVLPLTACEKDPDLDKLDGDYLVYTAHDTSTRFAAFSTYYLPGAILVIGDKEEAEYWDDERAQEIVSAFASGMDAAGYVRVADKDEATLGLQLSYVASTYYLTGVAGGSPWWSGFPGYWSPGYWGGYWGGGWYYPYPVTFSYSTGSLLAELVDLEAPEGQKEKLPVVWDAYVSGLLDPGGTLSVPLTVSAVAQAFAQSPYLRR